VLKDFRDREGDARYGKPTLLLRHGKTATCAVSLGALLTADGVLIVAFAPSFAPVAQLFVGLIAWMLWRLWRAGDRRAEQIAIGIGARVGNGLLLCALTWLLLAGRGASTAETITFVLALGVLFLGSSISLAVRPHHAIVGYKG
jgi:4-hydroxybenzoate polyprenyltransferase